MEHFTPQPWAELRTHPSLFGAPALVFANGGFAVAIFFVLSGFVLAASSDRSREFLPVLIFKRYLRLVLPIICAVTFSWILVALFQGVFDRGAPDLPTTLRMMFYDPFVRSRCALDPALWTMRIEFLGSIGIYTIFTLAPVRARIPLLVGMAIAAGVVDNYFYLGFPIGSIFYLVKLNRVSFPKWLPPLLILLSFVPAGFSLWIWPDSLQQQIVRYIHIDSLQIALLALSAAMLVGGIMGMPSAQRFLSAGPVRWLGRTSFGLYLVHAPLILTVFFNVFVRLQPTDWMLVPFFAAVIVSSLAGGWALTKFADEPTLRLLKRIRFRHNVLGAT